MALYCVGGGGVVNATQQAVVKVSHAQAWVKAGM